MKYRLGNGLAVYPEKDMQMLANMSKRGFHVIGINAFGLYKFEKGDPEDYIYDLNTECHLTPDFEAYYLQSGWQPIVINDSFQIFRAKVGTKPIFTDNTSKIGILKINRKEFFIMSSILLILQVLVWTLDARLNWGIAGMIIKIVLWVLFVFSFIPFLGVCRQIKDLNK